MPAKPSALPFPPRPDGAAAAALETRIVRVRLADLKTLDGEVNARFMPPGEWEQLVANIKADGGLTSTPLVAKGGSEPLTANGHNALEVLSGNHRVMAAIVAGVEEADVMEVVTPLPAERKRAIQLAHNKIAGKDDPSTLKSLYESLGLEMRVYTGLSDDDFQLPDVDLMSLAVGGLKYEEVVLAFLPPEVEAFHQFLDRTRAPGKAPAYLARIEDFDAFLSTVVKIKAKRKIVNAGAAVSAMIALANERLDQLEEAEGGEDAAAGDTGGA